MITITSKNFQKGRVQKKGNREDTRTKILPGVKLVT